jgi:hypothetical protein
MLAAAPVQNQGWACASLAIELRRVVDEDVTIRDDRLGIESKEILEELGRSFTCRESVVSGSMSKSV